MRNKNNNFHNIDELGYIENAYSAYLHYIKNFPPLDKDEIYALGIRSMNGDKDAKEKLFLHHLAFVVYVAKPYFKRYSNVEPMDIVQYGNEGLLKAIDMYDPVNGALTTYAADWIKQKITRSIEDEYTDLSIPVHIQQAVKKYKYIIYEVDAGVMDMPSDQELMRILKVSSDSLSLVKEQFNTTFVTMNKEIDEDGTSLEDFIESEYANNPEDVVKSIDQFDLLIASKKILNPAQYYVFYMRFFHTDPPTLEELGKSLNVTRERIRQLETQAKEKSKSILENNYARLPKIIRQIKLEEKTKFYKLNEKPTTPQEIVKYLYLKNFFNEFGKSVLSDIFIHPQKLTIKDMATKHSMTESEFKNTLNGIRMRIKKIFANNKSDFLKFQKDIMETYQSSVLEIDLGTNFKVDYQEIKRKYSLLSFDELKELFGSDFDNLPKSTKGLLSRYFSEPEYQVVDKNFIEREVNLAVLRFKNSSKRLSPKVLYSTYVKYKQQFTEEHQLLLENYFFKNNDSTTIRKKCLSPQENSMLNYLVQRLEKYHFGLINLFWAPVLTKEIYEEVLEKHGDLISDERKRILNLFFGVGDAAMSLKDIVKNYNLDYTKTHDFLRTAREQVYSLYLNRTAKKKIDKDIYESYILNECYELTPETREILKMHIIEGLSYDEISKTKGLNCRRVSNIVTDGLRKLDYYRFGLNKALLIDEKMLDIFYRNVGYNVTFSDVEKVIIYLRFIRHLNTGEILEYLNESNIIEEYKRRGLTKKHINRAIRRFRINYHSYLISNVKLTKEDLKELTSVRPLESVLTENERKAISFSCGIKNTANPTGKVFSIERIMEIMNITRDQYFHFKVSGIKKLKMHIAGLLDPPDIYMPLDELEKIIIDRHVPINDKERTIISYICALNGYPHKNFHEIADEMNDKASNIIRTYQRSMISIFKYLNGEIEGKIDYKTDIEPNLRYFNKLDQQYIIEYFENGLSYQKIAKKYSVSFDRIVSLFDNIFIRIRDIIENPNIKRFDYNYALSVIDEPDLPFYGDRETARRMFMLIFGGEVMKRLYITDVVKMLNLDMTHSTANSFLTDFMISIGKYREGVRLDKTFSYEEIKDYYEKHRLGGIKLKSYLTYFNKHERKGDRSGEFIPDTIKYDLIKERETNLFKLYNATRDEVISILCNKDYKLDKRVRESLMQVYSMPERIFMSGQEQSRVLRTLHLLDLRLKPKFNENALDEKKLKRDI